MATETSPVAVSRGGHCHMNYPALHACSRLVTTPFGLLGTDENALSFALVIVGIMIPPSASGCVEAQCPAREPALGSGSSKKPGAGASPGLLGRDLQVAGAVIATVAIMPPWPLAAPPRWG
jgi:hypothetical protein